MFHPMRVGECVTVFNEGDWPITIAFQGFPKSEVLLPPREVGEYCRIDDT